MIDNKHWSAAVQVGQAHDLKCTRFMHDGEQRISIKYGGAKMAKLPVDFVAALSWLAAFFPEATIIKYDDWSVIASV